MTSNQFRACRTIRAGVTRVDARLQDFTYPVHSHDHVVIGLVREGELSSRYGLKRYTVSRGQVLSVNPGEVHDGRPSSDGVGRATSMIEIDTQAFRRLCAETIDHPEAEFQASVSNDRRLSRALTRWLSSLQGDDDASEREAAAAFLGLLCGRHGELREPCSANDLARRVRARLLEQGLVADGIGHIAEELGVSRYQLIRAFKRAYGLTPEDFRRQLRVERARTLLTRPEPLAAIAVDAGFADQSHMTREFNRLLGLTPNAYRRALR